MHSKWKLNGMEYVVTSKQQNVQSTISVVVSMKKMPEESKKAKRIITLPKRLQWEAIIVEWQCEVNRSSIAVVHSPRRHEKTVAVLNYHCSWQASELAFQFYMSANHTQYIY